jgi:hypothetical protein
MDEAPGRELAGAARTSEASYGRSKPAVTQAAPLVWHAALRRGGERHQGLGLSLVAETAAVIPRTSTLPSGLRRPPTSPRKTPWGNSIVFPHDSFTRRLPCQTAFTWCNILVRKNNVRFIPGGRVNCMVQSRLEDEHARGVGRRQHQGPNR